LLTGRAGDNMQANEVDDRLPALLASDMPSLADEWDLIVVGAGLTGLIVAREAQNRGLRVVVFEARSQQDGIGGRLKSCNIFEAFRSSMLYESTDEYAGPTPTTSTEPSLIVDLGIEAIHPEHHPNIVQECHRYRLAYDELGPLPTAWRFCDGFSLGGPHDPLPVKTMPGESHSCLLDACACFSHLSTYRTFKRTFVLSQIYEPCAYKLYAHTDELLIDVMQLSRPLSVKSMGTRLG